MRLPGQYFDAETGLHHNGFRPYDPAIGRYLQADPVGLAVSSNQYGYVDSNPLSYIDPLGLAKTKTKGYWANCSQKDWELCEKECAPRRVVSCKRWWYVATEIVGGEVVKGYKPAPQPSCNCEEDRNICERNPKTCALTVGAAIIVGVCLAPQVAPIFAIGAAATAAAQ